MYSSSTAPNGSGSSSGARPRRRPGRAVVFSEADSGSCDPAGSAFSVATAGVYFRERYFSEAPASASRSGSSSGRQRRPRDRVSARHAAGRGRSRMSAARSTRRLCESGRAGVTRDARQPRRRRPHPAELSGSHLRIWRRGAALILGLVGRAASGPDRREKARAPRVVATQAARDGHHPHPNRRRDPPPRLTRPRRRHPRRPRQKTTSPTSSNCPLAYG
jgi:hypothetical protein